MSLSSTRVFVTAIIAGFYCVLSVHGAGSHAERAYRTSPKAIYRPGSDPITTALSHDALVMVGADSHASKQLTVFLDFQCPYCRQMNVTLHKLSPDVDQRKISIIYRFFPMPQHSWAMSASVAAACAAKQNQKYYFELSDYFFGHQVELTDSSILRSSASHLSSEKQFDKQKFRECIDSGDGKQIVENDIALGNSLGVRSTPTIFINSQATVGSLSEGQLRALLEYAPPL
jgi:protein-disulfide isomerase